jgi:predicted Mrr-cat superfamily restriction endonuclease
MMTNMKQKVVTDQQERSKTDLSERDEKANLGLDADHSSDDTVDNANLNNDNDRISHNPDGEDDDHDTLEEPGSSPLMDK